MYSSFHPLLIATFILPLFAATLVVGQSQPQALVIPLSRDDATLQQIIKLNQRTPRVTIPLTVDLQGDFLWIDCDKTSNSFTNRRVPCNSNTCALANPKKPCRSPSCNIILTNPIKNILSTGELYTDVVRINTTDGTNPVRVVSVPKFAYGCGHSKQLKGLAKGVKGAAGLGRTKLSLPSQFSSYFKFINKFSLCASSFRGEGFIIFGDTPINIDAGGLPIDTISLLSYTPLLINPTAPTAYHIGVTSLKIDQNEVNVDKSLLSISTKGTGGTKISTIHPYTTLQTSIYQAVLSDFGLELEKRVSSAKRVDAVWPFKLCYDSSSLSFTKMGVDAPDINLVMQSDNQVWTISGTNSMERVDSIDAYCLAFVDGGIDAKTSIVIGSYQLENNLLQFDLVNNRLGFSSSLLFNRVRCDNFDFSYV